MISRVLRLYTAAMAGDVRTPVPHLFGPPGCGKSTIVAEAAQLLGVRLHTVNVSRISPLELEGVQMPVEGKLELLLGTIWNSLQEGDIILWDEFLRGFPEVYNGLLDIFTSRHVAGKDLPKVFMIAASNSVVTYDPALEDRLLHIPAPDPRNSRPERLKLQKLLVSQAGLHPELADDGLEMADVMDKLVLPTYDMLDTLTKRGSYAGDVTPMTGMSLRKVIGQIELREVHSSYLSELLALNNRKAAKDGKWQYYIVHYHKSRIAGSVNHHNLFLEVVPELLKHPKLSAATKQRMQLNKDLLEAHNAALSQEGEQDD